MKRADLPKVAEIEARVQIIEQALTRAQDGTFKVGFLIVQGNGHGVQGTDGKTQQAESRLSLGRDDVVDLLRERLQLELLALRSHGVEM